MKMIVIAHFTEEKYESLPDQVVVSFSSALRSSNDMKKTDS